MTIVLQAGQDYYCSAANSTAYKFPMSDAKVIVTPEGARVEVPLDGTIYGELSVCDCGPSSTLPYLLAGTPLSLVPGVIEALSRCQAEVMMMMMMMT